MVAATRNLFPSQEASRRAAQCGWLILGLFFCVSAARAQAPEREDGLFISVRNPITSEVVDNIKAKTRRALERTDRRIRTIVFDFNPGQPGENHPSSTKEYGPCRDLADYILKIQDVKTVAFVHDAVTGHTVLPVLACLDITMSAEAKLGDVTRDLPDRLLGDQVLFYEHVATSRGKSSAIVLKMLDRDMEVIEARWNGSTVYIDRRKRDQEAAKGIVAARKENGELVTVLPPGNVGFYTAAQAEKFGLTKPPWRETRLDVVEAYQLAASSSLEDQLEGRDPKAYRIVINVPISKELDERLRRQIRAAVAHRANVLIFQMECSGGDTEVAGYLAEFVRTLKDDRGELPVMTIAYIPERAPGAATIFVLGCSEIAMGKKAQIGDFQSVVSGNDAHASQRRYEVTRDALMGLAKEKCYSPLLVRGMLDSKLTIYQVRSRKGNEYKLVDQEELDQDEAKDKRWEKLSLIKPRGQLLKLEADTARQLGLAHEIVDDFPDLCRKYGLKNVPDMGYDFLYRLAEFLAHPVTSVFLIMIGIACLILELKMPGVSLPGVIAAVCFVLYFWAQSHLSGQIATLAILLFVLGLILIGLEIFLLPGSVIMGMSGVVLVVLSLALATLEKKPETQEEWISFAHSLGGVGIALVGAIALAFMVAWYLPSIPYASRLILKTPTEAAAELGGADMLDADSAPQLDFSHLLGAIGVAATTLRPAGIARFGDDYVDVVTEGSYVEAGVRVQVIEIEGNRVVVKEV